MFGNRSSRSTNSDSSNASEAGKDALALGKATKVKTAVTAEEEGLSVS